jgi:3-carboxy-cis,cis-muconate cycloisomerase
VPSTFGFKVAVWIDELCRHVDRLRGCEPRVFVVMLGGAAGTFASFGPDGQRLQARLAERLAMQPMGVPARTSGDHLAEYVALLAMLAATCSKIGHEVFTLMKQEFGEVEEPVAPGNVGSSTMPQKRNPKLSQDVMAFAAQVRAAVPLALEAMQTEHEADRTTSVMMRRALDDACTKTGDILARLQVMFAGLRVFPERMRRNLDLSGGLIMSEALMLELGRAIGRQRAHDAIYEAAQEAGATGRPFRDLLAASETVTSRLSPEQIESLLDPARHAGLCRELALQQAAHGRDVAAEIRAG